MRAALPAMLRSFTAPNRGVMAARGKETLRYAAVCSGARYRYGTEGGVAARSGEAEEEEHLAKPAKGTPSGHKKGEQTWLKVNSIKHKNIC